MNYLRNHEWLPVRDYGCKWQGATLHSKLTLIPRCPSRRCKRGKKVMNDLSLQFRNRRLALVAALLVILSSLCAPAAQAQTRLIVRDSLGLPGINLTCLLTGCKVVTGLGDPNGQLFLVTLPSILNPITGLLRLNLQTGILSVEVDQTVNTQPTYAAADPSYLTDET